MITPQSGELTQLLEYLRRSRRFDFSGYNQTSLMRRIAKRMRAVGVSSYADFIDCLDGHPEEFPRLFDAILVKITSFFRDSAAWERVVTDVVPQLLAQAPDRPLRVWSAGCATGEEPYTLAMILADALGREQYLKRVKVYATDIDEDALVQARRGAYAAGRVTGVPPEILAKYFAVEGDGYVFDPELRRAIAFGVHDLIRDAPLARIDLLSCRNALMYFDADTQTEVLRRLHFALAEGGVLFLGRAEMLLMNASQFMPIDAKRRLFKKTPGTKARERVDFLIPSESASSLAEGPVRPQASLIAAVFEACPAALIGLDASGRVALANERARDLFDIGLGDVGRPLRELEIGRHPAALGSLLERACAERRSTTLKDVAHVTSSGETYFDVRILPLYDGASLLGAEIGFFDVTPYRRLQLELDAVTSELETASAPPSARDAIDARSELQSKVTELEIINAELLSASEELLSANEELKGESEALERRADESARESAFLRLVLGRLGAGLIVVDRDLVVRFCSGIQPILGKSGDEVVGKHLLKLGLEIPGETLKGAVRSCLAAESEYVEVVGPFTDRRGRAIRRRVTCMPVVLPDGQTGAILLIGKDISRATF